MNRILIFIAFIALFSGAVHAEETRVLVTSIRASSSLPDDTQGVDPAAYRRIRYAGDKAFDGRPDTAWAEGAAGAGVGESITIKLEKDIRFDAVEIMPGYFHAKYFAANNRIKRFRLEAGGNEGWKETFLCRDSMTPQRFRLSKQVRASEIKFFVLDTYKGSRWDDTCVSELTFFSGNDRYQLLCNRVEYAGGRYGLSFATGAINLVPTKGYMVLTIEKGGGLSGDFALGHQVGMPIRSGSWRFHADGTVDISYTHGDGHKRMGPDDEDLPPSIDVSGRMIVRLLGEFPPEADIWFGNGSGISCLVLQDDSDENGR